MFILQRIPLGNFFYKEILCKIFLKFQTWIGFFSTFFLQNQKTRKFRKFIYLELQLSQFSAKSGTKKFFTHFTSLHYDEAEGGRYATSLCFGFAAGQVGTPRASRHSVNPQQICFAEIRKYKNINSSWLVGVQSFSEIGDKKILTSVQFTFTSLHFSSVHWRLTLQVSSYTRTSLRSDD